MFVFLLCQSPSSIPQPRCAWSFGYDPKPFRKNSPRWPPANPPPPRGKGLSSLQIHLVCWSSSWSPPRSAEGFPRFKPRVEPWEATRGGTSARPPNPRYFVCLFKSQVWSVGKILVDSVPHDFSRRLFFGGGGTQSFIHFGPAWNRRKTEASPSTTWVFTSWSKLGSTFSTKRHFPSNDSKQLRTS